MHSNPAMQKLLEDRYYLRDEEGNLLETDPSEMYERVAKEVAKAEKQWDSEDWSLGSFYWQEQFYALMVQNKFLPNTPLLINAGKESPGSYSACFYIPVEDSMDGIFDAVKQAAIISKSGGGVGFNFSNLREKGSIVKSTGHKASGPVSFMRVFNTMCDTISQGGVRRGAMIALLSIDHPDIEEFIECKDDGVSFTNFNISVAVTNDFMDAVNDDDGWDLYSPGEQLDPVKSVNARDLWNKICEHAWKTGDPGLVFIDRMREDDPEIQGCNPCLDGDTLLMTRDGFKKISEGDTHDYKAWKTAHALTIKLTLSNGQEIICTPNHLIMNDKGGFTQAEYMLGRRTVVANKFTTWLDHEITDKDEQMVLAGFLFGESYVCGNGHGLSVKLDPSKERDVFNLLIKYGFKQQVSGAFYKPLKETFGNQWYGTHSRDKRIPYEIIKDRLKFRPFLRGLFEANGSVHSGRVSFKTTSKGLAQDIQILLSFFQIESYITTNKPRKTLFSNGEYTCAESYDLNIGNQKSIDNFKAAIGFISQYKTDKLYAIKKKYGRRFYPKVVKIEDAGFRDVYDFNMSTYERWNNANGIAVHNCGEIPLRDFESCNLGSINLLAYVKEIKPNTEKSPIGGYEFDFYALQRDIPTMVRFLDDVIDVNHFPLPEIDEATKKTRKIGLGVMGWADTLIKLKIPYDSDEAIHLARKIAKTIRNSAAETSIELGKEKGIAPISLESIDGNDCRNYTLMCVAPTGTISRIAGVSSGIEPAFAWETHHKLVDLEYDEVHWAWKELHESTDPGSFEIKTFPPGWPPAYMKTANEINSSWHVLHQAVWQEYCDNSVSKTVNLPNSATVENIEEIYNTAWDLGCKGITIYRDGCRTDQPLNDTTINVDAPDADRFAEQVADLLGVVEKPTTHYRNRGSVAIGATHKVETSKGKIYITVNYDRAQQEPNEVFIRLGTTATPMEISLAEWAGRLLSICLKHNVAVDQIQRQSNKIFSDASFVYDSHIFSSLPQAVSHLIGSSFDQYLENVGLEDTMNNRVVFEPEFTVDTDAVSTDKTAWYYPPHDVLTKGEYCYNCGEYAMIRDSGCYTCTNCGAERCG